MNVYALDRLLSETRRLAFEYRRATGKTLPVTAELAVQDAIRLLGLEPAPAGAGGYDAVRVRDGRLERLQIKGRAIFDERKAGHRLGQLRVGQPWDFLLLVLMDERYEPTEIYEADRARVVACLRSGASARQARRGALSVARFKVIGRRVWARELGVEEDGLWEHRGR